MTIKENTPCARAFFNERREINLEERIIKFFKGGLCASFLFVFFLFVVVFWSEGRHP